jgi:hypothetical protein
MRSLLSLYSPDIATRDHWLSCPSSLLLEQTEHIFHTGTSICAPVPIPAIVASNIAGCLHLALFERVARNAPSYRPPPRPVTITMRGLPPISPAPLPPNRRTTLILASPLTPISSMHVSFPSLPLACATPVASLLPLMTTLSGSTLALNPG